MERISECRAHDVVDGEVERGVEDLEEPHDGRDVEEPDGDGQEPAVAAIQSLFHSARLKSGKKEISISTLHQRFIIRTSHIK